MQSHSELKQLSFYRNEDRETCVQLFLGCSGGNGHNAAIEALIQFMLKNKYINSEDLKTYTPKIPTINERLSSEISLGAWLTHEIPVLSSGLKMLIRITSFPLLPCRDNIEKEIDQLIRNQNEKNRNFLDMLLDVCESGYSEVAVWNFLQKNDHTEELTKLINFQEKTDAEKYETVKKYFTTILENAAKEGKPYTEIISTQAMALAALCDAVEYYNQNIAPNYHAPSIKLHQYMTDLPTEGAIHFFNSLRRLTQKQRQQMYLYAVNFSEEIVKKFNLDNSGFAGLFSIDPQQNPMVRPGFCQTDVISNKTEVTLDVQGGGSITVKAGEKVAAIMLGSQASVDTVKYALALAQNNFDKIFVFGGQAAHIKSAFAPHLENRNDNDQIILLANQDDWHIAPIMSRSNIIIKRAGGLSVMEEMAMQHRPDQIVLIHSKNENGKFTSGISWEDCNADELAKTKLIVYRTTVDIIDQQLKEFLFQEELQNLSSLVEFKKDETIQDVKSRLDNIDSILKQSIENEPCQDLIIAIKNSIRTYINLTGNETNIMKKARAASDDRLKDMEDILEILHDKSIFSSQEMIDKINERIAKFEKGLFKSNAFFKFIGRSELKNNIVSAIKTYQIQVKKALVVNDDNMNVPSPKFIKL